MKKASTSHRLQKKAAKKKSNLETIENSEDSPEIAPIDEVPLSWPTVRGLVVGTVLVLTNVFSFFVIIFSSFFIRLIKT